MKPATIKYFDEKESGDLDIDKYMGLANDLGLQIRQLRSMLQRLLKFLPRTRKRDGYSRVTIGGFEGERVL